jgi:hypothetical protein
MINNVCIWCIWIIYEYIWHVYNDSIMILLCKSLKSTRLFRQMIAVPPHDWGGIQQLPLGPSQPNPRGTMCLSFSHSASCSMWVLNESERELLFNHFNPLLSFPVPDIAETFLPCSSDAFWQPAVEPLGASSHYDCDLCTAPGIGKPLQVDIVDTLCCHKVLSQGSGTGVSALACFSNLTSSNHPELRWQKMLCKIELKRHGLSTNPSQCWKPSAFFTFWYQRSLRFSECELTVPCWGTFAAFLCLLWHVA